MNGAYDGSDCQTAFNHLSMCTHTVMFVCKKPSYEELTVG